MDWTTHVFDFVSLSVSSKDWDEPEYIMDTSDEKPEDWDHAVHGEWSYPMVKNPLYKVQITL